MEIPFTLLVLGIVFAELVLWSAGTVTVIYAIFKPKKIAGDRKAKRLLVLYFLNAGPFVLAHAYPNAADTVFNTAKGVFLSSTPYAEGGLALIILVFIWLAPAIVGGFIGWLLIDAISRATASKVARRLKDAQ